MRRTLGIQNCRFYVAAGVVLLLGILIRFATFTPGLEYDEIWTFQHYSSGSLHKIFTDLATPNNHPLNSLLIKWSACFFSSPAIVLRLSAFLAGIATICLSGLLAGVLFRSRMTALAAMTFAAFNAGLILYSNTGRGYSLQVMLILLYGLCVGLYALTRRRGYLAGIFLTGVCSILTLPTSVLWLFPLSLAHCVYEVKRNGAAWKKYLPEFLTYLLTGGCVLFWLLYNYSAWKAGQSFGQSVDSLSFFVKFMAKTLYQCGGVCLLTAALAGLGFALWKKKNRFLLISLWWIVLFPLFGALFTKTGPPRVYLASVPFLMAAAGFGAAHLLAGVRKRKLLYSGILLLSIVLAGADYRLNRENWSRVDWLERFSLYRKLPPENFLCISPLSSYPAVWNNPDSLADYMNRFTAFGESGSRFLTVDSGDSLLGLELDTGSEAGFPLPFPSAVREKLGDMNFMKYRVVPYDPKGKNTLLLLKLENFPPSEFSRLYRYLKAQTYVEKVLLLNSFFASNVQRSVPGHRVFSILACKIKPETGESSAFSEFYLRNSGTIGFFSLEKE